MNKLLRHEVKMYHYRRRLVNYCIKEEPGANLYAFRSHGSPCSCSMCSYIKYGKRERQEGKRLLAQELAAR